MTGPGPVGASAGTPDRPGRPWDPRSFQRRRLKRAFGCLGAPVLILIGIVLALQLLSGTPRIIVSAGLFWGAVAGAWWYVRVTKARVRRRPEQYRRFAEANGLSYEAVGDPRITSGMAWPLPSSGVMSHRALDVVSGRVGDRHVGIFRRVRAGSDAGEEVPNPFALIRLPVALPDLRVYLDSPHVTIAPGLAPIDVDVENDLFNRFYRVWGARDPEHRRYAMGILNPQAIGALLAVRPFSWQIQGDRIFGWSVDTDPPELMWRRALALAGIAAAIPSFVFAEAERAEAERAARPD